MVGSLATATGKDYSNELDFILFIKTSFALEHLHLWHIKFGHQKLARLLVKSKQNNLHLSYSMSGSYSEASSCSF